MCVRRAGRRVLFGDGWSSTARAVLFLLCPCFRLLPLGFLEDPSSERVSVLSSSVCIYYYHPGALLLWRWGARQDTNWSQWNLILSVAVFELWTFELCVFLCVAFLCGLVAPSCLTLYDPMDCSLPVLSMEFSEWVVIPFSKESSRPWEWTWVSCITGRFFTTEPPGKA